MELKHITFDPDKLQLINELLNVLGLTTKSYEYEQEIDNNYKEVWGDDYDDEEDSRGGSVYTTIEIVKDFSIQSEAKQFISKEYVSYVNHHIKDASLDASYDGLYNMYELNVDYLYDAGTDEEFAISFKIELNGLRSAINVDAYFYDTDAVNKSITFLILSSS